MSTTDAVMTCICFALATLVAIVWFASEDQRTASYALCVQGATEQAERIECARQIYQQPDPPAVPPALYAVLQAKQNALFHCASDRAAFVERTACYDRVYGAGFDEQLAGWMRAYPDAAALPAPPRPVE